MKNHWRVYINPFNDSGSYSGYVEVTKDVDAQSIGNVSLQLDNTDLDIGLFRNSNFNLTLRNDHGRYSDVGSAQTLFHFRRADSKVKITWEIEEDGPYCGMFNCGEAYISNETTVFEGLLNDDGLSMNLDTEKVTFTCLGRESVFERVVVDTADTAGTISAAITNVLNDSLITSLLTVGSISVGINVTIDDSAMFANKTAKEALSLLLGGSNSVLYVDGDTITVSPRDPSSSVEYSFFGQSSNSGIENIQLIANIRNGLAKTFNYLSWHDVTQVQKDEDSIGQYGKRAKEINYDFVTNGTSIQSILSDILSEFVNPKQEFELTTPLNFGIIDLQLLDKISIDYPLVPIPGENPFPICGLAICGEAVLPAALFTFEVGPTDYYKVLGKTYDIKNALVKLKLRAI